MEDFENSEVMQETAQETVAQSYDDGSNMGVDTQVATEMDNAQPEQRQEYNWRAANESLSRMKDENNGLRNELNQLKGYVSSLVNAQQPQDQGFFQGREKDDLLSVGEVESYVSTVVGKKERELNSTIDMLQVQGRDPEFRQKIEAYQQYLTESQKRAILQSTNPWSDAYEAVVNSAAYYKDQITKQNDPKAQRIMQNASKPASLSSMGSAASLDRSGHWENMSDEQIIAMGDSFARGG